MDIDSAQIDYEVVALADGTWGVSVRPAGRLPRMETGFATRAEAETWMLERMEQPNSDEGLPPHI
jgi:hypothetical protein